MQRKTGRQIAYHCSFVDYFGRVALNYCWQPIPFKELSSYCKPRVLEHEYNKFPTSERQDDIDLSKHFAGKILIGFGLANDINVTFIMVEYIIQRK